MECSSLTIHCGGGSLHLIQKTSSSCYIQCSTHRKISLYSRNYRPLLKYNYRKNIFTVRALNDEEGSDINENPSNFQWSKVGQAFGRGIHRFYQNFQRGLKKETGLDIEIMNTKVVEVAREVQAATEPLRQKSIQAAVKLRFDLWPRFLAWNRLELWKDFKQWESKRIGAFTLYVIVVAVSFGGLFLAFRRARLEHQITSKLAESYLEAVIPDPSRRNVRKLKQGLWRRYMPEGLKVHKYHLEGDGGYHQSKDYVGQDAWEDDTEPPQSDLEKVINEDTNFSDEKNETLKELGLGVSGGGRHATTRGTWLERLAKWDEIVEKEKLEEDFDALSSKYAISFDWKEMKKKFQQQQERRPPISQHYRGEWISKRWWQYRPKLPYTYFLLKVECLEVEAVVFSENFKRIYVTMKEGFPAEYIVDIPADPYLSNLLTKCGVEMDTVYSRNLLPYVFHALAVMAPGTFLLLCLYNQLSAMSMRARGELHKRIVSGDENIVWATRNRDALKSEYKDVVLGGNTWEVFNETVMYMIDADKYLKKGAKLPRGILISGPPGTGKTLLARVIARESGLPFVFASASQFTSTDKRGSRQISELFAQARAMAPAFIFIDEVDALVGKHVLDDPIRRNAFDRLIEQLDGENTPKDVHNSRKAVVLLCATNRPDELHTEFFKRIEREVYIGLPAEEERVKIFYVHSASKRLAKDVNFEKLVFRTPGFSGADIQNLVNESEIMAIRKGHREIFQQDIIDTMDKQLFENTGFLITEEEQRMYARKVPIENKRVMAVHEAGHILLAHLLPQFDWHAITFLLPGGQENPLTVFHPRENMVQRGYATVGYLKMKMVVAHGGRCAEQIVFGDSNVTDGGLNDLAAISTIARQLVISPANPRLGLLPMTYKQKVVVPNEIPSADLVKNEWEDPESLIAAMSVEVSELFTREVTRYVEETEEEAKIALRSNRHILDRLVAELLEHSKLTGAEVEEIVKSMNPVMITDPMKMPDFYVDSMETSSPPTYRKRYQRLDISPAPLHRC